MKAVVTKQKYKCDYCKRRSTKGAMERHEKICFRNPNRFCDNCKNTGTVRDHEAGDGITETAYYQEYPCAFCAKRDPEIEKGIAAYEAQQKQPPLEEVIMPF